MIPIPRGRFVILWVIPFALLCMSYQYAPLFSVAVYFNIFLVVIGFIDIVVTLPGLKFEIEIEKIKPFSIGRINVILLKITNLSGYRQRLTLKLGLSKWIEDKTSVSIINMNGFTEQDFVFSVRPIRRGSYVIRFLYLRINSRLRLFYFDKKNPLDLTVNVYPDIKQLNYYLKLTRNNRDYKMGINKNRWMGQGSELESLRDYQKDDDSKFIDWKASTRLNRPISKVFQMESNNQITIALDCGRLMTAEQNGLSTLDHAINSLLILSHVAFNGGDSVSIIAFSDKIIGELSGLKGRDSLSKITEFVTKLQPEFVESNYSLMFNYLEKTQRKRALVIFLTDMIDDINYDLIKKRIHWLSRKHLILLILMQDTILSRAANQTTYSMDELYIKAAGREMLIQRNSAISKLKHYNINVLDVLPHELTGPLINKYLELKSRNRL